MEIEENRRGYESENERNFSLHRLKHYTENPTDNENAQRLLEEMWASSWGLLGHIALVQY